MSSPGSTRRERPIIVEDVETLRTLLGAFEWDAPLEAEEPREPELRELLPVLQES